MIDAPFVSLNRRVYRLSAGPWRTSRSGHPDVEMEDIGQGGDVERLAKDPACAEPARSRFVEGGVCRHEERGYVIGERNGAKLSQKLPAVDPRHSDVHQDQPRQSHVAEVAERIAAIGKHGAGKPIGRRECSDGIADIVIVIEHEDFVRVQRTRGSGRLTHFVLPS